MATVTKDDALGPPMAFQKEMVGRGIDSKFLITRLKRELNARETKIIKVKGAVRQEDLPKGFKIIATSGALEHDKEGKSVYGDGDTIIRYDPWAMGIQQRAREDAHKLRGDYAPQVVEVEGLKDIADRLQDALDRRAKE